MRIITIFLLFITLVSCESAIDNRYFAPQVEFSATNMVFASEDGEGAIELNLNTPASKDLTISLTYIGNATNGVEFEAANEVQIKKGESSIIIPITFIYNKIYSKEIDFEVIISPGKDYGVEPDSPNTVSIKITKEILLPLISIEPDNYRDYTNPFNAEKITFTLRSSMVAEEDIPVKLSFNSNLEYSKDFSIDGKDEPVITLSKGSSEVQFDIAINQMDRAGIDEALTIKVDVDSELYYPNEQGGEFTLRVHEPLVDFSSIFRTGALYGEGYQLYQKMRMTNGEWDSRNALNVNEIEGSNYLRSLKNLMNTAFGCIGSAPGGNILRLSDSMLGSNQNDTTIADYGSASNVRFFSAADSLFRFVPSYEDPTKGRVTLTSPKKVRAALALYDEWDKDTELGKVWHIDSRETDGNIEISTNPAILGYIEVEIAHIEGTYDLSNSSETMVFEVWFKSNRPDIFFRVPPTDVEVIREDGYVKIEYALYPRT